MRVITANIQNFPASAPDQKYPAKEAADMKTIHALGPDVVLWQELTEDRDFTAVITEFGNDAYGTASHESECIITWRRSLLALEGSTSTVKVADGMGPRSNSPARYICSGRFAVAGLPDVEVIDVHFTNEAYVGAKIVARQSHWDECWKNTSAHVLNALAAGRIVIVGGDWNRQGRDIPKFSPDQKWVVGGGRSIDNIAVLCPKGWTVTAHNPLNVDLNSDHNAKGCDLAFERAFTKAEQTAIDQLAQARTTLTGIGTARSVKALASVQDAINDLYGV